MDRIVLEHYLRQVGIKLDRFHRDEEGQGLVEYVLIIALIAIIAIAGITLLGDNILSRFNTTAAEVGP